MVMERIRACGLVPVVKADSPRQALTLARALLEGGVDVMEITFRTEAAAEAIAAVSREVPQMLVGAGTVLTPDQFKAAQEAGASFIVSPGLDPDLVRLARERDLPILPGVATASEVTQAVKLGLSVCKLFPAHLLGGPAFISALAGPFPHMSFLPTGGIDQSNAESYLRLPQVVAVGGSWLTPKSLLGAGDFIAISRLAAAGRQLVWKTRGEQ